MTEAPREQVVTDGVLIEEPDTTVVARMKSENARLRGELRQAHARAERAERSVVRMERSAKYTIGTLLVDAARHPSRLFLLPRDLLRIYRLRKHRRQAPPDTATGPARARREDLLDLDAARLLLPRAVARWTTVAPEAPRLSIAGALADDLVAAWSPAAAVTPLLPHDAAALATGVDPDVIVIDTAAGLPLGAWAHLGDPGAADREGAALRLVDAAHERGRPVVLLRRSAPAHTTFLAALAARCDLVLDGPGSWRGTPWNPGIHLGAALVAGAPWPIPLGSGLTWAGDAALPDWADAYDIHRPDPRRPAAEALARAIAAAGAGVTLAVAPDRVGAPPEALAMLAAGRRLMIAGGPGDQPGADADLADLVDDEALGLAIRALVPGGDATAVAAALQPMSATERWAVLRRLATTVAAPVRLADLAERLGLTATPLAVRDVAWVCGDEPWADAWLDSVLAQTHLPQEILGALPDRARDAAAAAGIDVRDTTGADLDPATACTSPWVTSADPAAGRDLLLDLVIAAEATGAAAVGLNGATLARRTAPGVVPMDIEHPGWSA